MTNTGEVGRCKILSTNHESDQQQGIGYAMLGGNEAYPIWSEPTEELLGLGEDSVMLWVIQGI